MHWCVHGGVGMMLANVLPENPAVPLTISVLSHYLLDSLPHKDPGIATCTTRWRSRETQEFLSLLLPDFAGTGLLGWFVPTVVPAMPFWTTAGCVLCAVLPDIVDGGAKLTNWQVCQLHRRFHDWIHYDHYRRPIHWGLNLLVQLGLFTASVVATVCVVANGTGRHATS